MKQNKYLEEVWEWKDKSNKELQGLSAKESAMKIRQGTAETIRKLGIRHAKALERTLLHK